ncbi:MAG TPA: hypothetical protein GX709_02265 [Clostridiales bacterium]|nr:hypothetical protein [Clostridiales bacterium]
MKTRKILIPILVIALVLSLVFSFAGCKKAEENDDQEVKEAALNVKDQTLLAVSTSGILMEKMQPSIGLLSIPKLSSAGSEIYAISAAPQESQEPDAEQMEVIEPYMDIVEAYLEGSFNITSGESDKEGFDLKYTLKLKDAKSDEVEIYIYVSVASLVDDEIDTTEEVNLDDFDKVEPKKNCKVDCLVVIGDNSYSVEGKYLAAGKKLQLKIADARDNSITIEVKDDAENNQNQYRKEFSYSIKARHRAEVALKIKMGKGKNNEKLDVSVKHGNGEEVKFRFKMQKRNGKGSYEGEIDTGTPGQNAEFSFSIDEEGNGYSFSYGNKVKVKLKRRGFKGGKIFPFPGEEEVVEPDTEIDEAA